MSGLASAQGGGGLSESLWGGGKDGGSGNGKKLSTIDVLLCEKGKKRSISQEKGGGKEGEQLNIVTNYRR